MGVILAISGPLGAGKTAFVKGLARGIEVPDSFLVTSPTFTIVNEYPGRLSLYHMDLYRIEDFAELEDFGWHDMLGNDAVVAIEWADKFSPDFYGDALFMSIEPTGDDARRFCFTAVGDNETTLLKKILSFKNNFEPK